MSRVPQTSDGRGSLKDIQILVNDYPGLFTKSIKNEFITGITDIKWISPLKVDDYAEYRDDCFINRLGVTLKISLDKFWPKGGPQWDALGRGSNGEIFLVEAKANIPEMASPPVGAKAEKSIRLINQSLEATRKYLDVNGKVDWTGTYYQYTNRMAHLYFLRVINNLPAFLVFVYFIGDKSVNGPESKEEWHTAISEAKNHLCLHYHKLSEYVADVFIDLKHIRD